MDDFHKDTQVIDDKQAHSHIHGDDRKDSQVAYATGEADGIAAGTAQKITRISSILTVLVSGLALFSDGYNAQMYA